MDSKVLLDVKKKTDWGLGIAIAVAIILMVVCISPVLMSMRYQVLYREFISAFSNSTVYAYRNGGARCEMDGQEICVNGDNAYVFYNMILNAGPGRIGKAPEEEPAVRLDFGDGSKMECWAVEREIRGEEPEKRLFVRHTDPEGKTYGYDTANITLEEARRPLQRVVNTPWS